MKDRLITLTMALLALLLTWILLVPRGEPEHKISFPTTEDRGKDGLKGLKMWLDKAGASTHSLRRRYSELPEGNGNLLILSLPHRDNRRASDWPQLAAWLKKGNSALILAAEYYRPPWSMERYWKTDFDRLQKASGILKPKQCTTKSVSESNPGDKTDKEKKTPKGLDSLVKTLTALKPEKAELKPETSISTMAGIRKLQGNVIPFYLRSQKKESCCANPFTIPLARLPGKDLTAIWQFPMGQGSVMLSLMPDLFSNGELGGADNAHFMINLLGASLGTKGRVVFDDFHFGLTEIYDESRFFDDPRLHNTLLFIAGLWLLYVVGHTNRLAPIRATMARMAEIDRVKAMTGFFAGRINRRALAAELVRHLMSDIRSKRQIGDEPTAWKWIYDHPALRHVDIGLVERAAAGQKVGLHRLTKTINEIRKRIL